ncbi:HlyD family type I secretion periplasmic adaptor subunit [Sphingorhabdus pulchriflava]|jgi:hemolysin D|uniref:Membrane fusion protein (MFP) family protein n=1 Tax=Sphingorhabdus pulchriflava TaxID=2292257 RepID=A0A371BII2_9SPHN|nr:MULTISPECIES: HlyD family type I secretion periplasmic adaptor subunit [Sphingorhabdus]RDV07390.1 HlyD family type I secretion periplasmic adaptor subunit [Sphingorhabdus pulchriflava]HMT42813.1 HlyD family type I secretion periplasmic adaptor subunit [Sphingorhabdus sp.]
MSFADRFPALAHHWAVLKTSWKQQDEREAIAKPRSDHEFLPAALEIMEKPPSPGLRYLMLALCALFAITLIWSFVGKVDVVATASGKVIPSGNVKVIQPIEIGYVRAIHVKNGQRVETGQLLVELDPTLAGAEAEQAEQSLLSAEVIAARNAALLTHLQGRPARFVAPAGTPAEIAETQANYVRTAIAEYEGEKVSLQQQRAQQQAQLAGAEAEISKLTQTLPLVEKQLEARKELADKGYFSKIRLLEYEQLRLEHIQNIEVQRAKAAEARAAIGNIDGQLARLKGNFGKGAVTEMAEALEKSGLSRQEVTKSQRRKAFYELRAPVSGTVQQLAISTIGGVVQPAQALMIIVPDSATAVVEANILNKDIGFVHEGQPVRIKLEAYNFTDYGIIPGVVESISRDAIDLSQPGQQMAKDPNGRPIQQGLVYATRIRLLQPSIRVRGQDQLIGPGLAVQAEIKTGERRIIDYLLSPMVQTFDEAGRER